MDATIFLFWIGAGVCFLFLERVVVVFEDRARNLIWQMPISIVCSIVPSILFLSYLVLNNRPMHEYILVAVVFVMTFLTFLTYILGIYSNVESSVSLKILSTVYKNKKNTVTKAFIKKEYSVVHVVDRRIKRLVAIGQIKKENDRYVVVSAASAFSLRNLCGVVLRLFFPSS
jgi:hypothetical protein